MEIEAPGQFFLSTVITKWWIVFDTRPAIPKTFSVPFFKLSCMVYDLLWVLKTKDLISLIVVRLQAIYSSLNQNNYLRAAKGKPPIYYYWVNIFLFGIVACVYLFYGRHWPGPGMEVCQQCLVHFKQTKGLACLDNEINSKMYHK